MTPRRGLHLMGSLEFATLVAMLINVVTIHDEAVSSILGPVHGLAYVTTVVTAVLLAAGRPKIWLLGLVPAAGGLLAARVVDDRHTPPVRPASGTGL